MLKRIIIGMMVVLMMVSVSMAREYSGVEMPEILRTGDQILVLNGMGERSVFMQQVYVVGLYLTGAEQDWQAVLDADEPMAIKLHVTNAFFASSERVMDALYKGFRNNMPKGDLSPIEDKVEQFNSFFSGEINKHDVFDIKYVPGEGVTVLKNDERQGTVPGADFKKNVFGVWIGETPVQKDMKTAMLAGEVTDEAKSMRIERMAQLEKEKQKMMAKAEEAKAAAEAEKKKAEAEAAAKAEEMEKAAEEAAAEAEAVEEAAKAKAVAEKKKAEEAAETAEKETMAKAEQAKKAAAGLISKEKFMSEDIYFTLGGDKLRAEARQKLDKKAAWLKANPDAMVLIEGHSDARGPKDLNYRLAEDRANSVKNYLVEAGVDGNRLGVISYGEERPIASGDNQADWRKNRRVHLRIIE
jgi:outer membrane protein OmpA-like peptidoglycan-associated protein